MTKFVAGNFVFPGGGYILTTEETLSCMHANSSSSIGPCVPFFHLNLNSFLSKDVLCCLCSATQSTLHFLMHKCLKRESPTFFVFYKCNALRRKTLSDGTSVIENVILSYSSVPLATPRQDNFPHKLTNKASEVGSLRSHYCTRKPE